MSRHVTWLYNSEIIVPIRHSVAAHTTIQHHELPTQCSQPSRAMQVTFCTDCSTSSLAGRGVSGAGGRAYWVVARGGCLIVCNVSVTRSAVVLGSEMTLYQILHLYLAPSLPFQYPIGQKPCIALYIVLTYNSHLWRNIGISRTCTPNLRRISHCRTKK